jgi:hypothetical protein
MNTHVPVFLLHLPLHLLILLLIFFFSTVAFFTVSLIVLG